MKTWTGLALAAVLAIGFPIAGQAKGYSSGSHSYSSHSSSFGGSHSFGSGGGSSHSSSFGGASSHSFSPGGGKSYSSGSAWSGDSRKSYSSGKSYGAAPHHSSSPGFGDGFSFDTASARARKEQTSKQDYTRFREAHNPPPVIPTERPRVADNSSYSYRSAPSSGWNYGYRSTRFYVPDVTVLSTRRTRLWGVFNPYWSRPVVVYHDPYSSFFWWWLLDQSIEDRSWWAYHHRYDMDPARYQALLASDQQLEARVAQLEAQQAPRDPTATPAGLDRDLMYTDQYVNHAYSNRPTMLGTIVFWGLGIPMALGVSAFFIWLIWFKRWQTAA